MFQNLEYFEYIDVDKKNDLYGKTSLKKTIKVNTLILIEKNIFLK